MYRIVLVLLVIREIMFDNLKLISNKKMKFVENELKEMIDLTRDDKEMSDCCPTL